MRRQQTEGVAQLTKALANEWPPRRETSTRLRGRCVATDKTQALRADPTRAPQILERIPAGRWGRPEDIAGAFVFLPSAASDYVHGIVLPVDGGCSRGDTRLRTELEIRLDMILRSVKRRRSPR